VVFELVLLFIILDNFVPVLKGCDCKIWMDELKYNPVMGPQTVLFASKKNTNCVIQFTSNANQKSKTYNIPNSYHSCHCDHPKRK
jgi:hypothetical protein